MKIRSGFVSNSSSSSFVCDVCDTVETGYDGEYDIDTIGCVNGHSWCEDHTKNINSLSNKEKKNMMVADKQWAKLYNNADVLKSGDEDAMEEIWYDFICDGFPEGMCPVCSLQSISDSNIVRYLLNQSGLTEESVVAEIRSKYTDLKDFNSNVK